MRAPRHALAAAVVTALAAAPAPAPATAGAGARVLVLPFEVRPAVPPASGERVADALSIAAAAAGYEVVAGDGVAAFLREQRIRYLDAPAPAELRGIVDAFQVDAVLAGTVLAWDERPAARDPVISLRAMLVTPDGAVPWTHLDTVTGAGQEGAFGRGRVEELEALAVVAVRRVARALPHDLAPDRGQRARWRRSRARVFRDPAFLADGRAVAVLPFENASADPAAPRVVDVVLRHRLAERGVPAIVPAGAVRDAIVQGLLEPPARLRLDGLRVLGAALGVRHFLTGTVLDFGTGSGGTAVELSISLVDVETGKAVWSALHRRTARDAERPFATRAPELVELADQVAAELVAGFTN